MFLSPEEIDAHKTNCKIDVSKSDMFNFGMILISLLLSHTQNSFGNETTLSKRLEQIESKFGFNVYFILEKMTRLGEKDRMEWYEIEPYVNELNINLTKRSAQKLDFRQGTFQRITEPSKNPIA